MNITEIIFCILFAYISFLAKRGVKDEIQQFDARKITPEVRKSAEELLKKNGASFDPKVKLNFKSIHLRFFQ